MARKTRRIRKHKGGKIQRTYHYRKRTPKGTINFSMRRTGFYEGIKEFSIFNQLKAMLSSLTNLTK